VALRMRTSRISLRITWCLFNPECVSSISYHGSPRAVWRTRIHSRSIIILVPSRRWIGHPSRRAHSRLPETLAHATLYCVGVSTLPSLAWRGAALGRPKRRLAANRRLAESVAVRRISKSSSQG
jgi:hypothetical protein